MTPLFETYRFFVYQVENWYKKHYRPLPWRKDPSPYHVWLAEIIFQQTRIEQGMRYYARFVEKYPEVQLLASAPEDEILRMWQGLGYYSRALNLHKTAKIIANRGGQFPNTVEELMKLPGIGPYTAGAIASIAFGKRTPLVDGNVQRVLSRFFGIDVPVNDSKSIAHFYSLADQLVKICENPSHFNQGLMDLGSLICKPSNPKCAECPLMSKCFAFTGQKWNVLPVRKSAPKKTNRYMLYGFYDNNGKIAVQKRGTRDIWKNLYQLPLLIDTFDEKVALDFENTHLNNLNLFNIKHILSHQVLYIRIFTLKKLPLIQNPDTLIFVHRDQLNDLGFPVPFQKFFSKISE
ncbi:A/G-specific adenine glycosylase [Thermaurantimonas aggregans]|uniref:Adenine DNA glycosylase n=1 Tax=Thermaurantimonas aggregans TaxID=2173829 RepID=A0A401XN96_9FLAO|nr:A/G-specific adenine glycosylase [Thermaurantimonas aggregans]MCX8148491.1 A/G-specific adenine glycosylase [Thermaurantimonas aggregans]GCD78475.1 A/G-specific adenine glycosylase [Thermaurantimonas aggregans]